MWRVEAWVRTCTILALVQVKPLHLNVLKPQLFLVWWGWEDSRWRGGLSPTSLGAAAWQQPQWVWGNIWCTGQWGPQMDPQGRNAEGQTSLCSFTARLWIPVVCGSLRKGSSSVAAAAEVGSTRGFAGSGRESWSLALRDPRGGFVQKPWQLVIDSLKHRMATSVGPFHIQPPCRRSRAGTVTFFLYMRRPRFNRAE